MNAILEDKIRYADISNEAKLLYAEATTQSKSEKIFFRMPLSNFLKTDKIDNILKELEENNFIEIVNANCEKIIFTFIKANSKKISEKEKEECLLELQNKSDLIDFDLFKKYLELNEEKRKKPHNSESIRRLYNKVLKLGNHANKAMQISLKNKWQGVFKPKTEAKEISLEELKHCGIDITDLILQKAIIKDNKKYTATFIFGKWKIKCETI